ncbi:hypothetical protein [Jeotgalibacillus aurantiacus]|uniref:hypothetical protein n=1 Tax=Jeotgalibacillus aurantiacus TaxID=2763266 RepID=UPI001D0BC94E|nr:hypothetical protein [Jeotgalibacillus aurantiacus]
MNKWTKWVMAVAFILIGSILFLKGLELQSLGTDVDGSGIGIYLGIFEINDRVMEKDIPVYAKSFLSIGGLFSITGILVAVTILVNMRTGRHA